MSRAAVEACPRAKQRNHSPLKGEPSGYTAWHHWAERKGRTHEAHRCPDCGLYAIWRPLPAPTEQGGN